MINLGMDTRPSTSATAEKAFSFISKGWREVRDSAGADLQLIRTRANSFKNLADRELENFLNSAKNESIGEFEFVKRIQPKLSEIRRVYSSPEFSRKVFEKWSPSAKLGIDLSAFRNAIVAEVDESGGVLVDFEKDKVRRKVRRIRRKGEGEGVKEWELIRNLKMRLKEFERNSQFDEIFGNFKSNELVEKVKLSLAIAIAISEIENPILVKRTKAVPKTV